MNIEAMLTRRESQICTGIVLGRCQKEIADDLCISPRTVEATIRNVMVKVDVKKSTDLVVFWFVTRFSIPLEALPKSITAIVFLLIWIPFEFTTHSEALRTTRTKTENVRVSRRNENQIEL